MFLEELAGEKVGFHIWLPAFVIEITASSKLLTKV